MNKSQRREAGHVVQEAQKIYWQQREEEAESKKDKEVFVGGGRVRKKREIWKVVEVFTWTCVISLCAMERGNWSMMEPVTLPGWNLLEEADRQEALAYLREEAIVHAFEGMGDRDCHGYVPVRIEETEG